MKKVIFSALVLSALISSTAHAASISLKLSADADSLYFQNKDTFTHEYTNFGGKLEINISEGDRSFNNTVNIPTERDKSTGLKSVTILKDNLVQFVDQLKSENGKQTNINEKVRAEIRKKGLFGKLTGLTIKSKELEALYADDIKELGLDQLKNFTASTEDLHIETNVIFSDMNCEIQSGGMQCQESFELTVFATDEK